MRLSVFISILAGTVIAVGAWSLGGGAGFGATVLRILAVLFALQIAYFAFLLLSGIRPTSGENDLSDRAAQGQAKIIRRAENIPNSANFTS